MKTIHDIVDKTLSFVFEHTEYKTIGAGRTDAKVSAQRYPVQLFVNQAINFDLFLSSFNKNAPNDLKVLNIKECPLKFNLIGAEKIKTYHYYFSFGEKQHPYAAPFMVGFLDDLDIEKMQKAAKAFEGFHYFNKYCCKPSEHTKMYRKIRSCTLQKNTVLQASFFPQNSYVLEVKGSGFLRYQIRYMMAVLIAVGKGEMSIIDVENSLKETNDKASWHFIAPSSGLHLYAIELL